MGDGHASADELIATAVGVLEQLAGGVAPGLRLPATLAGHRVDADATADLVFTLGLLHEAGVTEVAGLPVEATIHRRLAEQDARRTHTFFSYRIAETAARLGGLDSLDAATRAVVVEAADSTDWLPLLDEGLPRNYAVVLARCEEARARLGLDVDPTVVDGLLARARGVLGENPEGWLDDGPGGRGQVDMYTVDAYLFAEPFADRLGDVWERGVRSAARLVEAVATPGGQALPWGRSIGALAVCHTAELAALLLRRRMTDDPGRWLGLAAVAAAAAPTWFDGGLVVSHKRRAPFRYRGPFRRLQMTLDCAGKLVVAALDLRAAEPAGAAAGVGAAVAGPAEVFAARDVWIGFGDGLGAWARRDPRLGFTLPVVAGPGADYAPAPRRPGTFEVPTDRPLVCFVPVAWRGDHRFAPGGRATRADHRPGALDLGHDGFVSAAGELGTEPDALPGRRHARYRVEGRTLHVEEELSFDTAPGAVVVLVPEAAGQPLLVTAGDLPADDGSAAGGPGDGRADAPAGSVVERVTRVDVDGLAEWRSVTGELPTIHQVELRPAERMRFRWSVTPRLRVVSTADHHWYHLSLYGPLGERVHVRSFPYHLLDRRDRLIAALAEADVVHLHWPEWVTGPSARRAARLVEAIGEAGAPVVWTQHNLAPHATPDDTALYAPWAAAADGVIHHSEWGRRAITESYAFRDDALHAVVPHGHWRNLMEVAPGDREATEAEFGLAPCRLRIGLVGAPRSGKDTQLVLDGVAASGREDVQLLVLCHDGEDVPDDPRITVRPYAEVSRRDYDRRLAAIDVLALPLEGGTYLTTGLVADAVGAGIPALVSPWPYLAETLGDGGIPYGRTAADLAATIDALDDATLDRARAAVVARRSALDWAPLAEATWAVLDEVAARGATRRPR